MHCGNYCVKKGSKYTTEYVRKILHEINSGLGYRIFAKVFGVLDTVF